MKLISKTSGKTLIPKLATAQTFWSRTKGLLGRRQLPRDEALLIYSCSSIHTFFMRFAIDLVFVDSDLVVTQTVSRVKPGRFVFANFKSSHVVELSEGFLETNPIQLGEQLHVDHTLS